MSLDWKNIEPSLKDTLLNHLRDIRNIESNLLDLLFSEVVMANPYIIEDKVLSCHSDTDIPDDNKYLLSISMEAPRQ